VGNGKAFGIEQGFAMNWGGMNTPAMKCPSAYFISCTINSTKMLYSDLPEYHAQTTLEEDYFLWLGLVIKQILL
jgi:hypothetical protein